MPKFKSTPIIVTEVSNKEQEHHAKKPRKQLKHSIMHVMVNTNKQYNPESHQLIEECQKLESAANHFTVEANLIPYIVFSNPEHSYDSHVKEAQVFGGVERGELHDQVHLHLMVAIHHYSNIKLDIKKMKQHFLESQPELGNIYIHVNALPYRKALDPQEILKQYITKNVKSPETQVPVSDDDDSKLERGRKQR